MNRNSVVVPGIIVTILLAACGPAATPAPVSECLWSVGVEVWSDTDQDGERDPDEVPLPDVQMVVFRESDPTGPELVYKQTSAEGQAEFGRTFDGDCRLEGLKLVVKVPEGYGT